jgi:hypothetical protein
VPNMSPNAMVSGQNTPRVGQVGDAQNHWDNGLYTKGFICGKPIAFLVDSGSTLTLLSMKMYNGLDVQTKPALMPWSTSIQGVDGLGLRTYGCAVMSIGLESKVYQQMTVVCDIASDGILGQNFLLKHVNKLDFQRQALSICDGEIQCWIGGEAAMVCRVEVRQQVVVPANSGVWVQVKLPNAEHLGTAGLVEPEQELQDKKTVHMVSGIINTQAPEPMVNVINTGDDDVTLYPQTKLGTCESYYDEPLDKGSQPARSAATFTEAVDPASNDLPEYLNDLLERSSVHLQTHERKALKDLLIKYQKVFASSSDDLGRTDRIQHKINTGASFPIRQPPRRLPLGKREVVKQEVEKMLKKGVIEPSNSAWSSPVVLVTKKDQSIRFCIDYRRLNDVTIKDAYPLPRIDECLDALAGSKWLSSMDLNSGFWQLGMDPEDKEKTAFATCLGLYQFTVMPFGLANAPSSFERLMEDVLRGLQWEECLLYMDDIIVRGASFEENLARLEHVFQRLLEANLKLKPSKCRFFQKEIPCLGHIVSEDGVRTDPEKVAAVKNWPQPKNAKEIRSFLGLCSYYRKYVKGFAMIARPLHKLAEKNAKYVWTEECQHAFDQLKEALMTSPILSYPLPNKPFVLDTDASDKAVGAVLSQEQDGAEKVIAYMSKALNKHEQSYCVTRKELLAVVLSLRHFHPYVYGQKLLLRTDNAAVSWMRNLKLPTGQMARWLQELGTYNLEVTHRPGKKHSNADALSRMPCKVCFRQQNNHDTDDEDSEGVPDGATEEDETDLKGVVDAPPEPEVGDTTTTATICVVTRGQAMQQTEQLRPQQVILEGWESDSIRKAQLKDTDVGLLLTAVEAKTGRPDWSAVSCHPSRLKTLWRHWDRLESHSGMLYRRWTSDEETRCQLVVPESKQREILHYFHDVPSAGHLCAEKTLQKIKQDYYWPGMKQDTQEYCKSCDQCASRKPSRQRNRAPLNQYLSGEPMERVAIDILGPLPVTTNGNKYILVIVDHFTKWTESVALPNQTAETVAKAFVDEFVCRFGTPLQLHSDQGSNFESEVFAGMCSLLHIDKTRTTSMRPQANGCVERFNRTLESMLTMYCQHAQHKWDEYLPQVMMAYRASEHSSTGQTPNKMVFGKQVTLPLQAVVGKPMEDSSYDDDEGYVSTLQQKLNHAHELCRSKLKKSADYQKRHYDLRAKKRRLSEGQAVWLHHPGRRPGVCSKLTAPWKGPYVITKRLDDITYLVKRSAKQMAKAYHIDRLLPYQGRNPPTWFARKDKK